MKRLLLAALLLSSACGTEHIELNDSGPKIEAMESLRVEEILISNTDFLAYHSDIGNIGSFKFTVTVEGGVMCKMTVYTEEDYYRFMVAGNTTETFTVDTDEQDGTIQYIMKCNTKVNGLIRIEVK